MDAFGLIADFATNGTYPVTRRPRGGYVNGVATTGITSTFSIQASVQPASGRDLERLPEGRRALSTTIIFTTTKLITGGQNSPNDADLVLIEGAPWEIQHVEQWAQQSETGTYYRCIAQSAVV